MELQTLRDAGLDPMVLLTAHAPEAEAARAWGIEAMCGDIHDMPYESSSMAVVFTSNVMEHVFAPYLALMECRRVARMGAVGYHAIPEFEGPEHGVGEFHLHCLTEPVWRQLLTKTGWQVERVDRATRGDGHTYAHFLCRAGEVPHPHRKVLEAVEEARARA
jgi:SAM-dependent methyltransferase